MDFAEFYFKPKKWEGKGEIYKWLGVLIFKNFIVKLGKKAGRKDDRPNNYYLWDKSIDGINAFEKKTRSNELMHLAGMIIPVSALLFLKMIF